MLPVGVLLILGPLWRCGAVAVQAAAVAGEQMLGEVKEKGDDLRNICEWTSSGIQSLTY
jgi:hypothetical protein